jgi:ketosteroid isomerase-like protein
MASIEDNKAAVRAFFDTVNTHGLIAGVETLADDATWWAPGETRSKAVMIERVASVGDIFAEPFQMTPGTMTAEGDRVAAEATSIGHLRNGSTYANTYHFLFTVRDGVITSVREHNDTRHAAEIFATLLADAGQPAA